MKIKKLAAVLLALALLVIACAGQAKPVLEAAVPAALPEETVPQEAEETAGAIGLDAETPGREEAAPAEGLPQAAEAGALPPTEETGEADAPPEAVGPGTDFASTRGDLQAANGGELPWDPLSPEQQALVHYPAFDAAQVYWTAGGGSYHSVDWCYSLSRSRNILHGSLKEALGACKDDPCSKCVGLNP